MRQIPSLSAVLVSLVLIFCTLPLSAAPLHFVPQRLVQPDGSVLQCFASGDEYYNWLHDKDGYTIVQDEKTGWYVYAVKRDGRLISSDVIAGAASPAPLGVAPWLKDDASTLASRTAFSKRGDLPIIAAPTKGRINNIVVFIRFSDEDEWKDSISVYESKYNMPGAVSMRAYYENVSYGQLSIGTTFYPVPTNATVLSYQDTLPRARYMPYNATTNPTGYTSVGMLEQNLVGGAMRYVQSQIPDTLVLDGDKDGFIDNVSFIVSGGPTAWATLLWPHATSYGGAAVTVNGARLRTYNLLLQTSFGVSVVCHEMFHSLGAPDLYHYNHDGFQPTGSWDLMEQNATPPQHTAAYMKWRYGKWIASIPEIRTPGTYTLSPLDSPTNNCYKIPSPYSTTEYFVVEYRRKAGLFEISVPGSGLLVYRINTAYRGNASGPPDEVYIYRPGGTTKANGTPAQAFYNATVGRTAINDITNPSSFLTGGNRGGLNIFNVGPAGSTISFEVGLDTLLVQLTSPVAGSQLQVGSRKKISWLSFGMQRTLFVEYSADQGRTWTRISSEARGSLYWTVPNTPSRYCRMRIVDAANPAVRDSCSFAIAPSFYPIQFNYDVTDTTKARDNTGIVYVNGQFWTSRASSDMLVTWTKEGDMIGEFAVMGAVGIKSLTYDGSYVYAATGSDRLPKISAVSRARVALIMAPIRAEFIAYDATADGGKGGLWIGHPGSDLVLINMQGAELRRIDSATHGIDNIIGIAFDGYFAGDPYLWVFSKGTGAGAPQYLHRLRVVDGRHSGLFHDVLQDIGHTSVDGLAGGLCIATNVVTGTRTLCGTLLGTPNRLFGYELPQAGDALLFVENFPYPADSAVTSMGWQEIFGNPSPGISIADEGLFYPRYIGSNEGRAARLLGNSGPAQGAAHTFRGVQDGSIYVAAMLRIGSMFGGSLPVLALDEMPESAGMPVQLFAVKSGGKLAFGAGYPYPDAEPQIMTEFVYDEDSTYLVVIRTSVGISNEDSLAIWVNPAITAFEPEPDALDVYPGTAPPSIGCVKLIALDRGTSDATIDGIRIATRWDEAVRARPLPFSRSVLVLDATDEKSEPFASLRINDSTVDALYRDAFAASGEWDLQTDGTPKLEYLMLHRFVVMHGDHLASKGPHAAARIEISDMLQDYMDNGGIVMLSGWRMLQSFDWGRPFPRTFAPGSFVREYLRIAGIDETADSTGDFIRADGKNGFTSAAVDVNKIPSAPFLGALTQTALITATVDSTRTLFTYGNDPSSAYPQYRNAVIALHGFTPATNSYVLGFPMYFMKDADAKRLAYEIMQHAGVSRMPLDVESPVAGIGPDEYRLGQNFPNPFTSGTVIPFVLGRGAHVRLNVYDTYGRNVAGLLNAELAPGAHAARWNTDLPSGVYIVRFEADGGNGATPVVLQRRMLHIR